MSVARSFRTLGPAAVLAFSIAVSAQEPDTTAKTGEEAIPARALVGPGPFYVAQEVPIQVVVVGDSERPEIEAPAVPGATLAPAGTSMRPLTTSAIGDFALNESNAFAYAFRLVPERAGTLTVPPFVVRDGPRRGSTRPLRIEVRTPPVVGRPPAFVGGVGPIKAVAEVDPEAVRVGQAFEYRVRLVGPGARGSTRLPGRLAEQLADLPIDPEITTLASESSDGPPSRTFRFRVRPTAPGEVNIPPVLLAWFDPSTRRYQTVATGSPRVRVVDAPALDLSEVDYRPAAGVVDPRQRTSARFRELLSSGRFWATWWLPPAVGLLIWAIAQHRRRRRAARTARQAARRLARMAADPTSRDALPREILDALTRYLRHALGRPEGALTRVEARAAVLRATEEAALAEGVADLVTRCDEALYAPATDLDAVELARSAAGVFEDLAARTGFDRPEESLPALRASSG